jgi:signal transduction histidine kinase
VRRPADRVASTHTTSLRDDRTRREIERIASLLSDLSAEMAQAPADAVDGEIEKWLGKISLALNLDRSAIYERDAAGRPVRTSHTWLRANFPPFPKNYDAEKLFKKTTDWVMAGNQFVFARPSEIPFEVGDARPFIERYGPKASAVIPMRAGGRVIGAASFGRFRSPREWSPQLLDHLALVVRLFGSAIERKQAEALWRAAREELALAQRRSMMGELVASLTHELNQPLGAILSNLGGLARLMAHENPNLALAANAINNAVEDAKRAGEIVRRFRAMFKGDGSGKASIDMGSLVTEVVRLVGSETAMRGIIIATRLSPSLPTILGDRILLQQCILNLLLNAFDAVANVARDQRKVTIEVARNERRWVMVAVCDAGPGIDPSVAGRLFEPFVTTKTSGMGLGLLVTRSIVEEHGGKISAQPRKEGGTIFTFTLPIAENSGAKSSARAAGKQPREERKKSSRTPVVEKPNFDAN